MSESARPGDSAPEQVVSAARAPGSRIRAALRAFGMFPVLVVLCILMQAACIHFTGQGRFMTWQNLSITAQQASINAVLAAGMTFVIITGGIDLSVGSILAASAMVAMIVSKQFGLWGVLAALLTGLAFGLANGALIAYLRLPPFIVTLGSMTAVRGVARLVGNDVTVFDPSLSFGFIGDTSIRIIPGLISIPWLVAIASLTIVISWMILRRSVLGVHIYALGGNESAARLSGIKAPYVLLVVYGISGLLAGLSGVMQVARLYAANGLQLGQAYELDAIAAVILGGTSFVGGIGSIWGRWSAF